MLRIIFCVHSNGSPLCASTIAWAPVFLLSRWVRKRAEHARLLSPRNFQIYARAEHAPHALVDKIAALSARKGKCNARALAWNHGRVTYQQGRANWKMGCLCFISNPSGLNLAVWVQLFISLLRIKFYGIETISVTSKSNTFLCSWIRLLITESLDYVLFRFEKLWTFSKRSHIVWPKRL